MPSSDYAFSFSASHSVLDVSVSPQKIRAPPLCLLRQRLPMVTQSGHVIEQNQIGFGVEKLMLTSAFRSVYPVLGGIGSTLLSSNLMMILSVGTVLLLREYLHPPNAGSSSLTCNPLTLAVIICAARLMMRVAATTGLTPRTWMLEMRFRLASV